MASWGGLVCTTLRWRYWAKIAKKIANITFHKLANEKQNGKTHKKNFGKFFAFFFALLASKKIHIMETWQVFC